MAMLNTKDRPVHAIAEDLAAGVYTSAELTADYIARVEKEDNVIKAFLKLDKEAVMLAAEESDRRRASGSPLSPYDGIPVGIKDCIVAEGETCSCASKILEPVVSPYDSTAVARLKANGFIPFGRLNMDEFAMGSSCENSAFQKTANPRDPQRVPGGSSGGSAACVAASFAAAALGSDTGGSIRQPAAFCGIVGLKPTYGRVSRSGLVAFASSLDQIGPMTHDVEDAAILLDAIAGHDPMDSTSLPDPAGGFAEAVRKAPESFKGVKIGLPKEYFAEGGLSTGVEKAVRESIEKAKSLGAELVEVSLPHTKYAVAVYYIIATAEASANLARFDGMRYGKRVDGKDLVDTYFKSRGEGFGDEVKRRILLGTYVLSSGYYDAYYLRAQKVRTLIRRDFEEAFKSCDVLLTPVTPTVAFKFGEKSDPLQMYLSDIFTIALNLSGNCGISVPAGTDAETGMPVGMQLLAPAMAEARLLSAAQTLTRN
ncbi:Asp-tRNA(Asn)/Glu-tRNA(Gln) amidotransferase subunit GatA [uncultured Victivallis sp.]|uniref:Asp-tRNA(Asn)/Glu-tRNA(Gln) amidotransferase subunit GatA n=1 Tax=uncultured Victivallis sp. TaxID=354118 RepID=UPI00258C9438|nr:Asp-tRNA(Asn)/Glu-tRNA(Gln) amidotransferase subunit GatA [uncultured Victivallis sp.]